MNEVAKALHDGLDRLRERGLTKFEFVDEKTGSVCARGALINATTTAQCGRSSWNDPLEAAVRVLAGTAAEQFPDRIEESDYQNPHWVVVAVNDHDDTTQEDVERVFEKAIVRAYELDV